MTRRLRATLAALATLLAVLVGLSPPIYAQNANAVWVIPVEGQITPATAQFIDSRIQEANDVLPLALVFLINTPGGRVDAAQTISNDILNNVQVPTIAVVQDAFSAGAIIAMSAETVAMLPGASIGAATAINGLTGEQASEKINSAWRSEFRAVAQARGRNEDVAAGMVSESVEVPGLSTNEELITLTPAQAVEYNIANLQASSLQDALAQLGYSADVPLERLEPSTTERIAGGLTNPLVAAALLAIGILGIIIELFTPGLGLPGGLGALALLLFFSGAFIATPAGPLDLVVLLAGILLIAAEVFVIPGFGIAGILGIGAIIFAVFRIFQGNTVEVLGYTTVFGGVLLGLALWLLPNTRLGGIFTLTTRLSDSNSPQSADDPGQAKLTSDLSHLAGEHGVAITDLRPAGTARFGLERTDVVTEGGYVSRGSDIEVLRVDGSRVTVREVES